jgi:hypothetical protein
VLFNRIILLDFIFLRSDFFENLSVIYNDFTCFVCISGIYFLIIIRRILYFRRFSNSAGRYGFELYFNPEFLNLRLYFIFLWPSAFFVYFWYFVRNHRTISVWIYFVHFFNRKSYCIFMLEG